jgi:hypothetical protein
MARDFQKGAATPHPYAGILHGLLPGGAAALAFASRCHGLAKGAAPDPASHPIPRAGCQAVDCRRRAPDRIGLLPGSCLDRENGMSLSGDHATALVGTWGNLRAGNTLLLRLVESRWGSGASNQ